MNLDQRLADAARHVAGQVEPPEVDLDTLRSRANANRRVTVALAVAAAVLAVALAAVPLLVAGRDTSAPQPGVSPRSRIVLTLTDTDCAAGRCLKPRTYGIPLGRDAAGLLLRAKLNVPTSGWDGAWDRHRISRSTADGAVVLTVYQPHGFAGPEPCDSAVMTEVADAATMDEVVDDLTTLPQFTVVDGPRALSAFGRDTRYLKVRADRLSCPPVRGARYQLADIYWGEGAEPGGESAIEAGRPVLIEFWVLEAGGKPVVVEARQEGSPGQALLRQLDLMRESLTVGNRQ
jgi:hypothetical protein